MVKLQHKEREDREDQVTMTVPISKARILGWLEKLKEGEDVEVDVSVLPDKTGFSAREI